MPNTANEILANIVAWARAEQPIRALVLVGSRAQYATTDELADIDVGIYTETHEPYTHNPTWLSAIGHVWVCVPAHYYHRDILIPTRLVIFHNGIKVDFAFYPIHVMSEVLENSPGYRVLLDKDGVTGNMSKRPLSGVQQSKPTQAEFVQVVDEFWFEAYHVAKYLKREELWLAKFRDWSTKALLLKMMEWNEQAKHQSAYDTYYMGKHLRSWVSATTWDALHHTFARFDSTDSWKGLLSTIHLFRQLATETATLLNVAYPKDVDNNITMFILKLKEE